MKGPDMIVMCENCKTEFDKPNWLATKSIHHFCSRRCSNIKSNENRWKNHITLKKKFQCKKCGKQRDYRTKYTLCLKCYSQQQKEKSQAITIGDLKKKHKKRNTHRWYSAEIRNFARNWNPKLTKLPCQVKTCGYNIHTEICHIKPIKDFNDNTPLSTINNPSNLVVLCPNHHWEMDNGILKLSLQ